MMMCGRRGCLMFSFLFVAGVVSKAADGPVARDSHLYFQLAAALECNVWASRLVRPRA